MAVFSKDRHEPAWAYRSSGEFWDIHFCACRGTATVLLKDSAIHPASWYPLEGQNGEQHSGASEQGIHRQADSMLRDCP